MTTYTNWDLVLLANKRWTEIAEQISAEHHEHNQIFDLIGQVTRAHESIDDELEDDTPTLANHATWYAERITHAFRSSLQCALYAAQTEPGDALRTLAAIALGADHYGVASMAQQDASLLVAQVGDRGMGSSATHDIVRVLGGELVHHATELHMEGFSLHLPVALWRIPAENAAEWEIWRARVYGPREGADPRPSEERFAVLDQLRTLADAHA